MEIAGQSRNRKTHNGRDFELPNPFYLDVNIVPIIDNSYNLGSANARFKALFIYTLNAKDAEFETLHITGPVSDPPSLLVDNDARVSGNLSIGANIVIGGVIEGDNTNTGSLLVGENLQVTGDTVLNQDLFVAGNFEAQDGIVNDITVEGAIQGNTIVNGQLAVISDLTVSGQLTTVQNLEAENVIVASLTVEGEIEGDNVVDGSLTVRGDLNVEGATELTGLLTVDDNVFVAGDIELLNTANSNNEFKVTAELTDEFQIPYLGTTSIKADRIQLRSDQTFGGVITPGLVLTSTYGATETSVNQLSAATANIETSMGCTGLGVGLSNFEALETNPFTGQPFGTDEDGNPIRFYYPNLNIAPEFDIGSMVRTKFKSSIFGGVNEWAFTKPDPLSFVPTIDFNEFPPELKFPTIKTVTIDTDAGSIKAVGAIESPAFTTDGTITIKSDGKLQVLNSFSTTIVEIGDSILPSGTVARFGNSSSDAILFKGTTEFNANLRTTDSCNIVFGGTSSNTAGILTSRLATVNFGESDYQGGEVNFYSTVKLFKGLEVGKDDLGVAFNLYGKAVLIQSDTDPTSSITLHSKESTNPLRFYAASEKLLVGKGPQTTGGLFTIYADPTYNDGIVLSGKSGQLYATGGNISIGASTGIIKLRNAGSATETNTTGIVQLSTLQNPLVISGAAPTDVPLEQPFDQNDYKVQLLSGKGMLLFSTGHMQLQKIGAGDFTIWNVKSGTNEQGQFLIQDKTTNNLKPMTITSDGLLTMQTTDSTNTVLAIDEAGALLIRNNVAGLALHIIDKNTDATKPLIIRADSSINFQTTNSANALVNLDATCGLMIRNGTTGLCMQIIDTNSGGSAVTPTPTLFKSSGGIYIWNNASTQPFPLKLQDDSNGGTNNDAPTLIQTSAGLVIKNTGNHPMIIQNTAANTALTIQNLSGNISLATSTGLLEINGGTGQNLILNSALTTGVIFDETLYNGVYKFTSSSTSTYILLTSPNAMTIKSDNQLSLYSQSGNMYFSAANHTYEFVGPLTGAATLRCDQGLIIQTVADSITLKNALGTFTLNSDGDFTMSRQLSITTGGLNVDLGSLTVKAGGIDVKIGGASINGLVDIKGGLTVAGATCTIGVLGAITLGIPLTPNLVNIYGTIITLNGGVLVVGTFSCLELTALAAAVAGLGALVGGLIISDILDGTGAPKRISNIWLLTGIAAGFDRTFKLRHIRDNSNYEWYIGTSISAQASSYGANITRSDMYTKNPVNVVMGNSALYQDALVTNTKNTMWDTDSSKYPNYNDILVLCNSPGFYEPVVEILENHNSFVLWYTNALGTPLGDPLLGTLPNLLWQVFFTPGKYTIEELLEEFERSKQASMVSDSQAILGYPFLTNYLNVACTYMYITSDNKVSFYWEADLQRFKVVSTPVTGQIGSCGITAIYCGDDSQEKVLGFRTKFNTNGVTEDVSGVAVVDPNRAVPSGSVRQTSSVTAESAIILEEKPTPAGQYLKWNYTGQLFVTSNATYGNIDYKTGLRLFLNNATANINSGYTDGTSSLGHCATLRNELGDLRVNVWSTIASVPKVNVGMFITNDTAPGLGIIVVKSTGNTIVTGNLVVEGTIIAGEAQSEFTTPLLVDIPTPGLAAQSAAVFKNAVAGDSCSMQINPTPSATAFTVVSQWRAKWYAESADLNVYRGNGEDLAGVTLDIGLAPAIGTNTAPPQVQAMFWTKTNCGTSLNFLAGSDLAVSGNFEVAGTSTIPGYLNTASQVGAGLMFSSSFLNVDFVNSLFAGVITTSNATQSTSSTTGSITSAGGIGVVKNAYIGGVINIAGSGSSIPGYLNTATQIGSGLSFSGGLLSVTGGAGGSTFTTVISTSNTTAATSTTTGALKAVGGLGIGGSAYIGGIVNIAGSGSTIPGYLNTATQIGTGLSFSGGLLNVTGGAGGSTFTTVISTSNTTASTSTTTGAITATGGLGIGGSAYIGGIVNIAGSGSTIPGYLNTATQIGTGLSFSGGLLNVTGGAGGSTFTTIISTSNTTASTSTTTGAITAVGGLGVGGAVNIGSSLTVNSTTDSSNSSNGSIKTLGGIGVAKSANIGGTLNVAGTSTLVGVVQAQDTTDALFPGTAALVVLGGVSVIKKSIFSDSVTAQTTLDVTGATTLTALTTTDQLNVAIPIGGGAKSAAIFRRSGGDTCEMQINSTPSGTTGALVNQMRMRWYAESLDFNVYRGGGTDISSADLRLGTSSALGVISSAFRPMFWTKTGAGTDGTFRVSSTTNATSSTTGSMVVSGGMGIANDLYIGNGFLASGGGTVLGSFSVGTSLSVTTSITAGADITTTGVISSGRGKRIGAFDQLSIGQNNFTGSGIIVLSVTQLGQLLIPSGAATYVLPSYSTLQTFIGGALYSTIRMRVLNPNSYIINLQVASGDASVMLALGSTTTMLQYFEVTFISVTSTTYFIIK